MPKVGWHEAHTTDTLAKGSMRLSVVIITRNEAPRLRLCLASIQEGLARMGAGAAEVIVVDDGSLDETSEVLKRFTQTLPLTVVHHSRSLGRSCSRNAGAQEARGEIILFLDGDTLVSPQCLERHAALNGEGHAIARGAVYHLRQARFLRDPERGELFSEHASRPVESHEFIREEDVRQRFAELHGRSVLGIYPGSVPRRLAELELAALNDPSLQHSLWMAVSAHNFSLSRESFLAVGGFCETLEMNEHRDLALTLFEKMNIPVRLIEGAESYHICHSTKWRDPLQILEQWEPVFKERHSTPEARLLPFFWMSLQDSSPLPEELAIRSIPELIAKAQGDISSFEKFRQLSPLFGGG